MLDGEYPTATYTADPGNAVLTRAEATPARQALIAHGAGRAIQVHVWRSRLVPEWFDVDKGGLANILARRGLEFVAFELI